MKNKINFENLTFDKFKVLALSNELSSHEKVGFPDEYRKGREEEIFSDIRTKMRSLNRDNIVALDIGPGCSQLPLLLGNLCQQQSGDVHFVDSKEMLDLLPNAPWIHKWARCFPDVPELFEALTGKVDSIVVYSVIQYVFAEGNLWDFVDCCLSLLNEGGEVLLGDIPNTTMRKRFFSSSDGIRTHQEYTQSDEIPDICFNQLEPAKIDDSVVLAILSRARAAGFHAWALPQGPSLPMSNRREDILIRRP
ncbi:SAM-dependent methyltransferase [Spartinivicinus ruber]|uniref:SAM-dependent methyltransferase n=1 Tax=Spartinivicinus ruber TaxID=2683272 RepID=UPI0013D52AA6|nr:SAM-dependent methyltransferase [Spartinivicinus ruber]